MAIAAILGLPITYDIYTRGLSHIQIALVTVLMIFFYVLTINNLVRKVITRSDGIDIITYLGKKSYSADDISNIDGYSMGKRQFIIIASKKRHSFIQNSFVGFLDIVSDLKKILPEEKIKEGITEIQKIPLERTGDTVAAWLTVVIMILIIIRTYFLIPSF